MIRGMPAFLQWIFAFFIWILIGIFTFLAYVAALVLRPFDRKDVFVYKIAHFWGRAIVGSNPFWNLTVSGVHHLNPKKGYVLVANHSSFADIVCLYLINHHFKWIAKASLFQIPIFGWTLSLLHYIPLSRGRHGSIRDSFQEAIKYLDKNISVLIFPEGTRSKTGHLAEFKNGAFKLALQTKKPVVPIVIKGTNQAMSKGKAVMAARVDSSLKVLPPVDVSNYKDEEYARLRDDIWQMMKSEIENN